MHSQAYQRTLAGSPDAFLHDLTRREPHLSCLEACTLHIMEVPSRAEQLPGFLYLNFRSTNHVKKAPEVVIAAA